MWWWSWVSLWADETQTNCLDSSEKPGITLIKKKIKFSSYKRKFRMEQLRSHIWLTASSYTRKFLRISSYLTLQLLHSEFPYIWGKFDFLFYQCRLEWRDKGRLLWLLSNQKPLFWNLYFLIIVYVLWLLKLFQNLNVKWANFYALLTCFLAMLFSQSAWIN